MRTTILYVLLSASRDWLFVGLLTAILITTGLSLFFGSTSLVEQQYFSLALSAGVSRAILMIGLILFVCFHIRRSFENREIEVMLSRPISRTRFVLAYWLGFCALATILVITLQLILMIFFTLEMLGWALWATSLLLEAFIVIAFALSAAFLFKSAVIAVLTSFGFYLASRLMGFFIAVIDKPGSFSGFEWNTLTESALALVAMVIPRLDLFAKTDWLIYGLLGDRSYWIYPIQAAIYVPLLLMMTLIDFRRRQF